MITLHDSEILSVEFFPAERKLIFKTEKRVCDAVHINMTFFDVYAYSFKEINEENIIDEVTENSIFGWLNWYYSENYGYWRPQMEYGLPLPFADKETAIQTLKDTYHYYEINACVGMDGWVVAGKWKIEHFPCEEI